MLDDIVEHLYFRDIVNQMGKIEGAQRARAHIFNHPDGASCV
jgi:hypothetical protein